MQSRQNRNIYIYKGITKYILRYRNMDKEKIIRKNKYQKRVPISIKLPESASKFMKENNYSPTGVMLEALKDLGWK